MNRRRFLAALAAVPFVGKALVDVEPVVHVRPGMQVVDYNEMPVGLLDSMSSTSVHGLNGNLSATWRKIQRDMRIAWSEPIDEWELLP